MKPSFYYHIRKVTLSEWLVLGNPRVADGQAERVEASCTSAEAAQAAVRLLSGQAKREVGYAPSDYSPWS